MALQDLSDEFVFVLALSVCYNALAMLNNFFSWYLFGLLKGSTSLT